MAGQLTPDTEYEIVSWENNTDAGTNTATVKVAGKGAYEDTEYATAYFTIAPRSLEAEGVTISEVAGSYTYTGAAQKPSVTIGTGTPTAGVYISDSNATLTDTDFQVDYSSNTTAGEAAVVITGTGNYTGTISKNFTIEKAEAQITVDEDKKSYTKTFGDEDFTLEGITENSKDVTDVQYSVTKGTDVVSVENGSITILKAGEAEITLSLPESDNYKEAENQTVTVSVAKKGGFTPETVNKSYYYKADAADTVELAALLPTDCGAVTYENPTKSGNISFVREPAIENGILSYTVNEGTLHDTETITVTVETENYQDITVTVSITLGEQKPVVIQTGDAVTLTDSELTYGQALSTITFNKAVFVEQGTDNVVEGTLTWKEPDKKPATGTVKVGWLFTPANIQYAALEGVVSISVAKAEPKVTTVPTVTERTYHSSNPLVNSDLRNGIVLGVDGQSLAGSWSWQKAGTIAVVNNSGYTAVFTPNDNDNYKNATATITVKVNKAQNAPNMPESNMSVANSLTKVSEVTLPEGWEWKSTNKDKSLEKGNSVTATAITVKSSWKEKSS